MITVINHYMIILTNHYVIIPIDQFIIIFFLQDWLDSHLDYCLPSLSFENSCRGNDSSQVTTR